MRTFHISLNHNIYTYDFKNNWSSLILLATIVIGYEKWINNCYFILHNLNYKQIIKNVVKFNTICVDVG
jgi:hypothetical protein